MNFGQAQDALRQGQAVARKGWNGDGMWLELQRPDAHSKMTVEYIFITTPAGQRMPWTPSQLDLFALDWFVV